MTSPDDVSPGHRPGRLGFPVHAVLVLFPMGALLSATAFDIASRVATEPYTFPRSAFWLIVLGLAGSLVSGGAAFAGLLRLPAGTPARRVGAWHVAVTDLSIALFVISLILRFDSDYARPVAWAPMVTGVLGSVAVIVGAGLGARLTYRHDVGVSSDPPT